MTMQEVTCNKGDRVDKYEMMFVSSKNIRYIHFDKIRNIDNLVYDKVR